MRTMILLAFTCGLLCSTSAISSSLGKADTGQYTEFEVPNEPGSVGDAINNRGTIAGSWEDSSGLVHSFVRDSDGTITAFDPRGSIASEPVRINGKDAVIGWYDDPNYNLFGYMRKANGKVISFAKEGVRIPGGINTQGDICGSLQNHQAFLRTADGTVTEIDPPNSVSSFAAAINDDGTLAGSFGDAAGQEHGFIRSADGTINTFNVPNSMSTYVRDINSAGVLVGSYTDSAGAQHGFLRDASGKVTTFQFSKTNVITEVDGLSINNKGFTAGHFRDPNTQKFIPFERKPSGAMIYLQPPGVTYGAGAYGINDHGVIVGFFYPSDDHAHGYYRTP